MQEHKDTIDCFSHQLILDALSQQDVGMYLCLLRRFPSLPLHQVSLPGGKEISVLQWLFVDANSWDRVAFKNVVIPSIRACRDKSHLTMVFARELGQMMYGPFISSILEAIIEAGIDPNVPLVRREYAVHSFIPTIGVLDDRTGYNRAIRAVLVTNLTDAVAPLLAARADVSAHAGGSLLVDLVRTHDTDTLRLLLEAKAPVPTARVASHESILVRVVHCDNHASLDLLIKHRANVDVDTRTPLDFSGPGTGPDFPLLAISGSEQVTKALLDARADPNRASPAGVTALDACDSYAMAYALLERGARAGSRGARRAMAAVLREGDAVSVDRILTAGVVCECIEEFPDFPSPGLVRVLHRHNVELWGRDATQQRMRDLVVARARPSNALASLLCLGVVYEDDREERTYRYPGCKRAMFREHAAYRESVLRILEQITPMVNTISIDCCTVVCDFLCPWQPERRTDTTPPSS